MGWIYVKGGVRVEDIISALGLGEDLTAAVRAHGHADGDRLEFDDVEVAEETVLAELDEDDEPAGAVLDLDESDVIGLAEAVRLGDRSTAEILLDRIVGNNPNLREWVDRGRYSGRARQATAAPAQRQAA